MSVYARLNGKGIPHESYSISINNRSFRYGDGFFETIKVINGIAPLFELHMDRLFASLFLLGFELPVFFTRQYLQSELQKVIDKNGHEKLARIRLTVFRGDGGLYDDISHFPNHLVQSFTLNPVSNMLNQNGLVAAVYKDARKGYDCFSAVKSNNYLSYAMAALWAKKQRLNDCLLLNHLDKVVDSTIANVFIIHKGIIKTPPLTDGPVGGVMRQYLIGKLKDDDVPFSETTLVEQDLLDASEVFFTNAIYGLKWVRQLGETTYNFTRSALLHQQYIAPLFRL